MYLCGRTDITVDEDLMGAPKPRRFLFIPEQS